MTARELPQRSFGDWLRQRRRELDLTQAELARQIGCSTATLHKLETEQRRPSKPMAERVAEVLSIPLADRPDFLRFARGDPFAAPGEPKRQPAVGAPRHNLPTQLTSFIGRDKEIAEVRRILGSSRLVTLTGVGGAGKTRLALQAAANLLDAPAFPDGVWLVELAPLADPAAVPRAMADVLGLKEQVSRPMVATLTDRLRAKAALLILDNCEHLIGACAQLAAAVLQGCPAVRLLATSREALGIPGETLFVVPALSLPNTPKPQAPEALIGFEAVRLFVERASTALPGFALTADNAAPIARICQQLDGLPLAIELAAARVKILQVEQIEARLNDRFGLLTGGSRVALPRHQTLQALIDWSHDLLTVSEQVLLRRLAVFVGGWTLAAAEATCAGDGLEASEVLDLLTQLVNKSLVAVERQPGLEARYRLLETIRQYALSKLTTSGEADAVWRRLAEYYYELAQTPGSIGLMGALFVAHLRLEPERDNLRAALEWSQTAACPPELGLRLAGTVLDGWIGHGYLHEVRGFLERALVRAEGTANAQAQAEVLHRLGTVEYYQGDYDVASTDLQHSMRLSQALNDRLATGWILMRLGEVALEQGDVARASARQAESLALFRELQSPTGVRHVFFNQVEIAVMQEDPAQARALVEQCLALMPEFERPNYLHRVLYYLGLAAQLEGDFERAHRYHQESLARALELGEPNTRLPWAHQGLGETALGQGDADQAARHFITALKVFDNEGDRGAMAMSLSGLAGAAALDEEPERAAWLWGAGEALRLSIGARQAPATRTIRERLIAAAREQLGEEPFAAAWAAGAAAPLVEALRRAYRSETES